MKEKEFDEFIKKLKEACNESKNYCDENRAIWFDTRVIDKLAKEYKKKTKK